MIQKRRVGLFLLGLLIGLLIPIIFRRRSTNGSCENPPGTSANSFSKEKVAKKKLIFVGIMTTETFLGSRGKAVYDTWAQDFIGSVKFFSSNTSKSVDLPVVPLHGVDDSYPPQKKSMMMLRYMYDNYGDEYEWFLRSDDNVYIRGEKLKEFLRMLDSSQDLYIGQAGNGRAENKGKLGLDSGDNFCMGGPGVVFSSGTLKKVAPYLEHCLDNVVSHHEDVEVGRCIKQYVGISCTRASEMKHSFYHNDKWEAESVDTASVRYAITYHPVKKPEYMKLLHLQYTQSKVEELNFKIIQLQRRLKILDLLQTKGAENITTIEFNFEINRKKLKKYDDLIWELFTPRKMYSCDSNTPQIRMLRPTKDGIDLALKETMSQINQDTWKVLHFLEFTKLNQGVRRYHPMYGMQYILDLSVHDRLKKREGVHYRSYLEQPFGNVIHKTDDIPLGETVHFIVPLEARLKQFQKFMANYEKVCLKTKQKTTLLVLYFTDVSPGIHMKTYRSYKDKYPKASLEWISLPGEFTKSLALNAGAAKYDNSSLLFFCDVDMQFTAGSIDRCRANTILGSQVYYPIVFSQFSPDYTPHNIRSGGDSYLSKDTGFWRDFGFGMTCQYRLDLDRVGGFDETIRGWGKEDVVLFDRYVNSGKYTIYRAIEPGLIHIYHDKICDLKLKQEQLTMCLNTRAACFASQRVLYEVLLEKGYIKE